MSDQVKKGNVFGVAAAAFFLAISITLPAAAFETRGYVGAEGRYFFYDPLYEGQRDHNGSLVFEPEFFTEVNDSLSCSFIPFLRLDSGDAERSHADLRELQVWFVQQNWELRLGVGKVFWGTTEFVHLVDIINQTDLVEDIDGEQKLGQPMLQLSLPRDIGYFDFFLLPWFRERTFAGEHGRLRPAIAVDVDHPRYVSAAEEHHLDYALRFSTSVGDADLGLYYFDGTGREPTLLPGFDPAAGTFLLTPLYEQIRQFGFDMQAAAGNFLLKLEALHRRGQGRGFAAATGGLEYTFFSVADSLADLGLLLEFAYDDRREMATTFAENELMAGLRFSANDQADTTLLAGLLQDLDSRTRIVRLEASRRLGERWKLLLEGSLFLDVEEGDVLYSLRKDDYLSLELRYYF